MSTKIARVAKTEKNTVQHFQSSKSNNKTLAINVCYACCMQEYFIVNRMVSLVQIAIAELERALSKEADSTDQLLIVQLLREGYYSLLHTQRTKAVLLQMHMHYMSLASKKMQDTVFKNNYGFIAFLQIFFEFLITIPKTWVFLRNSFENMVIFFMLFHFSLRNSIF